MTVCFLVLSNLELGLVSNNIKMKKNLLCLQLIFLVIASSVSEPFVQLSQGTLNGTFERSRYGRTYSAFKGIPYAEPPIGNLRFASPVPAGGWKVIRQASSFGNKCPQADGVKLIGNEDCLFLNVYTPFKELNSRLKNDSLLPVMFWVHGGAYVTGSSNIYRGEFLLDKDIVLVTINYRLGILGFLSTGDSVAPGNFGMKDQVLALKWVQQNIKAFGGDPSRVTLFGESAGGSSVALHAISKASSGLFHQYIIESGANLCPWAYQKRNNYISYVREIGILLACPYIDSQKLIDCLRKRDVNSLINTSTIFSTIARLAQITWTPTDEPDSENAFLTDSPQNLIDDDQMKDLPFMSGVNTDEGLLITETLYDNNLLYELLKPILRLLIPYVVDYYIDPDNEQQFVRKVDKFYFDNNFILSTKDQLLGRVTKFITDGFFHYPQIKMLQDIIPMMENSNYFYSFGYKAVNSAYSKSSTKKNRGVTHTAELYFLFPLTVQALNTSLSNDFTSDINISNAMVDLWTSFAINGKPNSKIFNRPNMWTPYTLENETYLQIGNIRNNTDPSITVSHHFYNRRIRFWEENVKP